LTELNAAIDNLNNLDTALANLLQYNDEIAYTINSDGTITVDFTNGLGQYLETAVKDIVQSALNDVTVAVKNLEINILSDLPIVGELLSNLTNGLLIPMVSNVTNLVTGVSNDLTTGVIDISTALAGVQVIG